VGGGLTAVRIGSGRINDPSRLSSRSLALGRGCVLDKADAETALVSVHLYDRAEKRDPRGSVKPPDTAARASEYATAPLD
jgi:hypothetical protein